MKVLAVTGGIGSGKSEVCRILAENGLTLQYNADSRAKCLYLECPGLLDEIEIALGGRFRDREGNFVPSRLAAVIFSDNAALEKVEALLFPEMIRDFHKVMAKAAEDQIVVFESATFLEKKQFDGFADIVLLVDASFDVRLERACRRDGASKEAILARMKSQRLMNELSEGLEDPRISYKVRNDGTRQELERNVLDVLAQIRNY
ncbi:MAG: dephospho-CoA kinase [Bacteroidales bacterium]|nr:dephospho-CoA kinase [Bacteroidales bacterium]